MFSKSCEDGDMMDLAEVMEIKLMVSTLLLLI